MRDEWGEGKRKEVWKENDVNNGVEAERVG